MKQVELPKDALGREIPLDTVVLYDGSGNAHNVSRFVYVTDFDVHDKDAGSWIVIEAGGYRIATELMYRAEPECWEKLVADLGEALHHDGCGGSPACAYLAARGMCPGRKGEEGGCTLFGVTYCERLMVSNIRGRIKRLCAGEGE